MILYHLQKAKYRTIWPPEGALFGHGRWNRPGQWIIYSSGTLSLVKLEILANEPILPVDRVCMSIEVAEPFSIMEVEPSDLPLDWYRVPYPNALSVLTKRFLAGDWLLMKVPSAQSFSEFNYLISVRHARFREQVRLIDVTDEHFDPRLKS